MKKFLFLFPALFLASCAKKFESLKKRVSTDYNKVNDVVVASTADFKKIGLVVKYSKIEDSKFLEDLEEERLANLSADIVKLVPKRVARFSTRERLLTKITDVCCYPFLAYVDLLSHNEDILADVIKRAGRLQAYFKKRMHTYQKPEHINDLRVIEKLDADLADVKNKARLWRSILIEVLREVKATKEYREEKVNYTKEMQNQKIIDSIDQARKDTVFKSFNKSKESEKTLYEKLVKNEDW